MFLEQLLECLVEMFLVIWFVVSDPCWVISPVERISDVELGNTMIILLIFGLAQCLRVFFVKECLNFFDWQKSLILVTCPRTDVDHVFLLVVIECVKLEEAYQDIRWGPIQIF